MKLVLKNPEGLLIEPLRIVRNETPCLDSSWHYHAQYELLYISKSNGIRFVGDSVSQFFPGDLVLVGPYLPHLWRNDASYYQVDDHNRVGTIVIKFTRDFIAEGTFENPRFSDIRNLLDRSKFGISFGEAVSADLHDDLINLVDMDPGEQLIKVLTILWKLSGSDDCEVLSSTDMRQYTQENSERLDDVLKYISDNYHESIGLQDVANIACMTTNSFCRFFKKQTNKSFTQFLNEVRIRNASRLLIQENIPVAEICYRVGYKSMTNFYRQFRQIMGDTPKSYRRAI